MKRALLLVALLVACDRSATSDVDTAPSEVNAKDGGPTRVRVVAANLTSGDRQSYDPGHGARILQTIGPDVVLFQEMNVGDGSDAALRSFVDGTFGKEFAVHREAGSTVPNGVVSRFPIVARGEWTDPGTSGTRDFAWARIDLPGPHDLWAVSVHLKASADAAPIRLEEARSLIAAMKGASIPDDAYVVIGGDFNTEAPDEPCLVELGAVVETKPPFPVDAKGNGFTNAPRNAPYDWVFANAGLAKTSVPVELLGASHANGLVFDTRVATAPPALADDSAAVGMQHMAVVRDFVVR